MSSFLAQAFSLYFIIVGIAIVLNTAVFVRIYQDFFENRALLLISGIIALILGILIVLSHNIWMRDWQVVITIIGWMSLLKGIGLLWSPESLVRFSQPFLDESVLRATGIILMGVGAALGYVGFLV